MPKIKIDKLLYANIFLVISALIYGLLCFNKKIIHGAAPEWVYGYFGDLSFKPFYIFFFIAPYLLFFLYLTYKYMHKREVKIILLWFFAGLAFQGLVNTLYPHSLGAIIQSDMANSFYSPTLKYAPAELLENFNSIKDDLPLHAKSNMPGKILFFYLLGIFTKSPQIMGYLIIAFSNLGAIIVYFICKKLFSDKLIAIYSLILYLFIPAKQYFFPILNTVSPVFILLALFLFIKCLESQKTIYSFLFGLSIYVMMIFDPLPLSLGIFFLAILWKYYYEEKINKSGILKILFYGLISFLLLNFIIKFTLHFDILETLLQKVWDSSAFNDAARSYQVWIIHNLKEFFINAGVTQSLLFFGLVLLVFYNLIVTLKNRIGTVLSYVAKPEVLLVIAFVSTLLIIDYLGINRGEVTRLWIFLTPFIQIFAAYMCATKLNKFTFHIVLLSTLLQTTMTLSMISFIIP